MNRRFTFGLIIALVFVALRVAGQTSCTYRLELFDSRGNGWDNATLTLEINGEPNVYTLNGEEDDGSFRGFDIELTEGDSVRLIYSPGFAERENSYAIYSPEGLLLFGDGPSPRIGVLFGLRIVCPSCPAPSRRRITIDDIRSRQVDISWTPVATASRYLIEYDTAGFTQGRGRLVSSPRSLVRLAGLQEKTRYQFYLSAICANGDTSIVQGPFPFETLWTTDVGISAIFRPGTSCNLGPSDTVRVGLTNFGGDPKTLIPFEYSVNGENAGVNQPFDGFFTGVVGNDSTALIDFETTFDFSQPGEYVISAWTELEGDQDKANDTTTVIITNIPLITEFPYYENFEVWAGGWTVDTLSLRPSWAFGRPAGDRINQAAGGSNAWVTNLEGAYNRGERSYLLSPCLDFSSFSEDPRLSFSLFYLTETSFDRAWVELSTDGGLSWQKVGARNTGLNWYNAEGDYWTGDIEGQTWNYAFNTLKGAAGKADVRVRFVFSADNATEREGVALDNIRIATPQANDLAAISAVNTSMEECGSAGDRIRISITNVGTRTQSNFRVGYRINGGMPVVETAAGLSLAPNQTGTYTFNSTFNSALVGELEIIAWADLAAEEFRGNDTTRFLLRTARSLPFAENFESGAVPSGWNIFDAVISSTRGNTSNVLADNLFAGDREFMATTPVVGPVSSGDTLAFDYRFVNNAGGGSNPKILTAGEKLEVQISVDCGQTYSTVRIIDEVNHTPSTSMRTIRIPLASFAGQAVKIKFLATWVSGDFWIDIDNVNIRQCPASLQLQADVLNVSTSGARDGSITIQAGADTGPFTYLWSTGDSGKTLEKLGVGAYEVTVTDRFGCTDALVVEVGIGTSIQAPNLIREFSLAPNPTNGRSRLRIAFIQAVELRVQLLSLMGQTILETSPVRTDQFDQEIELGALPEGIYLIRIMADRQVRTEKLLLAR